MEEKQYSVIAKNISKCYKMYSGPKQKLIDLISPKGAGKTFYALKDISFEVEKGQVIGLLGLNGSGKSTLSNILGGVSIPSKGDITLNGESSVIAIGLGLNNFLTGIENIEVKALMMGYKKDDIEIIKQEVIEFADIGDFINQQIRTYSSGMRSRLGFAISVHTNPDILVIDEALSVGDPTFTSKCLDKMNEFRDSGKTIFFVSHSTSQVRQFCTKAMWLEYGSLKEFDDIEIVLPKYETYINMINKMSEDERKAYKLETLKDQEHSLLREFKLIDPNLKKVKPTGRFIKNVELIGKDDTIKVVTYNIDVLTLAFGAIPSFLRKRYDIGTIIFIAQILNLFIIPFPAFIVTNFLITFVSAMFTGRNYVDYLIEKKSFIPFYIWNSNIQWDNFEDELKFQNNKVTLNNEINKNKICNIISTIFLCIVISSTFVYEFRNEISSLLNQNKENITIKNTMVVIVDDKEKENRVIDNIAIFNTESSTGKVKVDIYPGALQVKSGDSYNELKKVVDVDNMDTLKDTIKANLSIDVTNYTVMNTSDFEQYNASGLEEFYNNTMNEFLEMKESELKDESQDTTADSETLESRKRFHKEYKNNKEKIIFKVVKYQEIKLTDIVGIDVLKELDMENLNDYKLYVTDNRMLQNNILVKEINTSYKDYIENKYKEEILEDEEDTINDEEYEVETEIPQTVEPSPTPPAVEPEPPIVVPEPEPPVVEPEPEPEPPVVEPEPPLVEPEPPVEDPVGTEEIEYQSI